MKKTPCLLSLQKCLFKMLENGKYLVWSEILTPLCLLVIRVKQTLPWLTVGSLFLCVV